MSSRTRDSFVIEDAYEFCAPKFVDFTATLPNLSAPDDADETWFDIGHSPITSNPTSTNTPNGTALLNHSNHTPRSTINSKIAAMPDTVTRRLPPRLATSDVKSSIGDLLSRPLVTGSPIVRNIDRSSNIFDDSIVKANPLGIELGSTMQPEAISGPILNVQLRQCSKSPFRAMPKSLASPKLVATSGSAKRRGSVYERLFKMTKKAAEKKMDNLIPPNATDDCALVAAPAQLDCPITSKPTKQDPQPNFSKRPLERPLLATKSIQERLTKPRSPKLLTKFRAKPVVNLIVEKKPLCLFKVTPLSRDMFIKPSGIPPKKVIPLTVPETPAVLKQQPFRKRNPSRDSKMAVEHNSLTTNSPNRPIDKDKRKPFAPPFKARPAPKFNKPAFKPIIRRHQPTIAMSPKLPGKLISERKRKEFAKQVESNLAQEQKARQFKARQGRALGLHDLPLLPNVHPKPLTKPKSPKFLTDQRGQRYQKKFQEQIENEHRQLHEAREFHSHPVPQCEPFVPKKSTKPLTRHVDLALSTEARHYQRQIFEDHLRDRQRMLDQQKQELDRQAQEVADLELQEYRKSLVHRARPVKKYAPLEIKRSERPLTCPISPKLSRARNAASSQ